MSGQQNPYYYPVQYPPPSGPSIVVGDPVNWRIEGRTAAVVAVFATLLGSLVGVVWHAVAPRINIVGIAAGRLTGTGFKPMIGDDVWLGVVGIAAAVVCVAALLLVAPDAARGPGATVGLAIGGFLGMLVAARVGHLIGHSDFDSTLRAAYPNAPVPRITAFLGYYDFSLRAKAALFTWPLVSLALNTLILSLRTGNQPTPLMASAYPGSS
ncbi:MAG: hypothetical protein ACTHK4_06290 [Mycobacteriales bacterium]